MRKIFIFLVLIFFLTGCQMIEKKENDYSNIINTVMNKTKSSTNTNSLGFKYYLPKGVRIIDRNETNVVLNANGNNMYLYVDIVSYYYKKNGEYTSNKNNIYYQSISDETGYETGYVEIKKENSNYYLEIVYNYAKIEVYTNKFEIHNMLIYGLLIVKSIDYNEIAIKKLINQNYFSSKTKNYYLKKPKETESNSLESLGGYKETENSKLPD